ncbi:MAG: endonuclease SmrB [Buchnera aphidicola]|nr:endonuclease SmrB [Buchnera aphidicola]
MNKNRQHVTNNILFRQWMKDTREIEQDTIFHSRISRLQKNLLSKRMVFEEETHRYYLSKNIKNYLFKENPVSYIRDLTFMSVLKNLKKGKYYPDIFLDLHGFTQFEAQKKVSKLIAICQKEKIFCAHIMHGYGKYILKKQIPFWLSQHPDVIAFHQAPKTFGNDAAIIVIIEINSF